MGMEKQFSSRQQFENIEKQKQTIIDTAHKEALATNEQIDRENKMLIDMRNTLLKVIGERPELFEKEPVLWTLISELQESIKSGQREIAVAAVRAFTDIISAKIDTGARGTDILFSAIRVTEASSAGIYKMGLGNVENEKMEDILINNPKLAEKSRAYLKLSSDDMKPLWDKIGSVPKNEWVDQFGNRGDKDTNIQQMIGRACGIE